MSSQNSSRLRRDFLRSSLAGGALISFGVNIPSFVKQAAAQESQAQDRILVVLQLSGGNDGLNTVIPFRDPAYRAARPTLAIPEADQLKISSDIGLHPSLRGIADLFEEGMMSVVQGVGYPSPNRSHFESMDIWHFCQSKESREREGWLGKYLAQAKRESDTSFLGLHYGSEQQPAAMIARGIQVPSISSLDQFRLMVNDNPNVKVSVEALTRGTISGRDPSPDDLLHFVQTTATAALSSSDRIVSASKVGDDSLSFPKTQLGEKLKVIANLISSDIGARVYYVTLDGFDTHAQQPAAHAGLLQQWSDALTAFVHQLDARGDGERVTVMTFSEFGRRVAENASDGTDHGAAAPVFIAGKSVQGGIIGAHPSLTDLDDSDLKYHTDFRQVYASLLRDWLRASPESILGDRFSPISLFSHT